MSRNATVSLTAGFKLTAASMGFHHATEVKNDVSLESSGNSRAQIVVRESHVAL
jgi:hypothetical protein